MLLRSSSTPVLGSLLSSISESPNNNPYTDTNPISRHANFHHSHKKLSFNQSVSVNSSPPMTESSFNLNNGPSSRGFRRAHSEGNLQTLAYGSSSSCNGGHDESYTSKPPLHKASIMLETIPSFSFHNSKGGYEDEEEEEERSDEENEEIFMVKGGGGMNKNTGLVTEKEFVNDYSNVSYGIERDMVQSEMYLARGLGVSVGPFGGFGGGGGGGWGGNFNIGNPGNGAGDGDNLGVEEHYKRMVEENPCNSLFLRNYAQFLYQSKKDLAGAEEYYSRAILADPKDGDILCQYAKLIWELHCDEDRALSYFERAVQASPEDSHVHAAYASFIWEIEDDENEDEGNEVHLGTLPRSYHHETMASVVAAS